jgi:hypothetical protein
MSLSPKGELSPILWGTGAKGRPNAKKAPRSIAKVAVTN